MVLCLTGYGSSSSSSSCSSYNDAITEGQIAAQELIDQNKASIISIALVDANRIIWTQTFGLADPVAGQAPTDTTMIGIGSVSKLFSAIAVMKLVERRVIDLDTPLVSYLPDFKMASEGYEKITVRMLLNHSAGFPGTDYRNADVRTPVLEYPDQVLQTLSHSRLKAPPGYMSVYCNDCFTVIEALVRAKTGKQFSQFVKDEILTPLHMQNTRFPLESFEAGSYAKAIKNGVVKPQEFVNASATGGIYSTTKDMGNIAMMFLRGGTVKRTRSDGTYELIRILKKASVAEMAKDQTLAPSFSPVHNSSWAFGLGWDTVTQPGLLAVGFDGWGKGGDSDDYGAQLIVSPKAGLGIVVLGASGFGSEQAKVIAERVLLRALAENHKITTFPSPLTTNESLPTDNAPSEITKIEGLYAASPFIAKFDNMVLSLLSAAGWNPNGTLMQASNDGWFASIENPLKAFKTVTANLLGESTQYVIKRAPNGYGHYLDTEVFAQQIQNKYPQLSPSWQARVSLVWLAVNEHPDELTWNGVDPRLRLATIPEREGLIAIRTPLNPDEFHILNPSESDTEAKMMLVIPQLNGRDLDDLTFITHNSEEWARLGSYVLRPLQSVPQLTFGKTETITIGPDGYAEWRAVAPLANPAQITITTAGSWRLYDAAFKSLAYGKGNGTASLPTGNEPVYLTLFGTAGNVITVDIL